MSFDEVGEMVVTIFLRYVRWGVLGNFKILFRGVMVLICTWISDNTSQVNLVLFCVTNKATRRNSRDGTQRIDNNHWVIQGDCGKIA